MLRARSCCPPSIDCSLNPDCGLAISVACLFDRARLVYRHPSGHCHVPRTSGSHGSSSHAGPDTGSHGEESGSGTPSPVCPMLVSRRGERVLGDFPLDRGGAIRSRRRRAGWNSRSLRAESHRTHGGIWDRLVVDGIRDSSGIVGVGHGDGGTSSRSSNLRPFTSRVSGWNDFDEVNIAGDLGDAAVCPAAEAEIQYERSGGVSPVARRRQRVETKVAERLARGRRRSHQRET